MKPSIEQKLTLLSHRYDELTHALSEPNVMHDSNRFKELSKEYAHLEPLMQAFKAYQALEENLTYVNSLLTDPDPEIQALAQTEITEVVEKKEACEHQLYVFLIPEDPNDKCNVFLEIRAAAGGDESAIFAGDLFRMYSRFAEMQRWTVEIINDSPGEHGGYKEIVVRISGRNVYSQLKFESGAHRVQRVPETEAQGRIHTSTCTVAVLPEVEEVSDITINPSDLKIDTFRASGAGGQHVNKTDSAIRITHIPSGTVIECQEERSQHKNRAKAMSLLKAKILNAQISAQRASQAQTRRNLVGTGDRSERIRTYNFPQGRITDHRINLTLYKLADIMEGHITPIITALAREHEIDELAHI